MPAVHSKSQLIEFFRYRPKPRPLVLKSLLVIPKVGGSIDNRFSLPKSCPLQLGIQGSSVSTKIIQVAFPVELKAGLQLEDRQQLSRPRHQGDPRTTP